MAASGRGDATEPIAGWILAHHLRAFPEPVSHYAGYAIDATDRETVELGVRDTDDENPDAWYSYPLGGAAATLDAEFAHSVGTDVLMVRVAGAGAGDHDLRLRTDTLLTAFASG